MIINMYGFKNFHGNDNIKKAPAERQGYLEKATRKNKQ